MGFRNREAIRWPSKHLNLSYSLDCTSQLQNFREKIQETILRIPNYEVDIDYQTHLVVVYLQSWQGRCLNKSRRCQLQVLAFIFYDTASSIYLVPSGTYSSYYRRKKTKSSSLSQYKTHVASQVLSRRFNESILMPQKSSVVKELCRHQYVRTDTPTAGYRSFSAWVHLIFHSCFISEDSCSVAALVQKKCVARSCCHIRNASNF